MRHRHLLRLAVFGALLMGCYSLQPIGGVRPTAGKQIALGITDAGRSALGGAMGPEIDQVEGRLLDASNGEYVLSVSGVKLLRGGYQAWTGERVSINRDYVSRIYERRFSAGRTIALGVVVAGAAVLLGGKGLGIIDLGEDEPPNDTGVTLTPRPFRPVRP